MRNKKKGLSDIISYLLLVSFAIILSGFIYNGLKTYIPKDTPECPEGVSVYIKEAVCSYEDGTYVLDLTLINNGRFNVAGYYIYVTNSPEQEIAVVNIFDKMSVGGNAYGETILFEVGTENSFKVNEEKGSKFQLDEEIYLISIIPTRFNEIEEKMKYLGCNKARITEKINCS